MTIQEFIFDSPIYYRLENKYVIEDEQGDNYAYYYIDDLVKFDKRVECYCPKCGRNRVFAPDIVRMTSPRMSNFHHGSVTRRTSLTKTFRCSQESDHELWFGFLVDGEDLVKISEYPSKLDMSKSTIAAYEKVLSKEKVSELGRALQLESYGYSIAAILHYRRIFEYIIFNTFKEADIDGKVKETEFRQMRMDDKIKYVKEHLPDYFAENSYMYGVLSKGIHELEERECSDYLQVVKTIIYYSLDESLDKRNIELRKENYSKQLSEISSNLGK